MDTQGPEVDRQLAVFQRGVCDLIEGQQLRGMIAKSLSDPAVAATSTPETDRAAVPRSTVGRYVEGRAALPVLCVRGVGH